MLIKAKQSFYYGNLTLLFLFYNVYLFAEWFLFSSGLRLMLTFT